MATLVCRPEGDRRAIDFGEFANLQATERPCANGENERTHCAVSHIIAGSDKHNRALHHAEKRMSQTSKYEKKNSEWKGNRRAEQSERTNPGRAKGKNKQREALEKSSQWKISNRG